MPRIPPRSTREVEDLLRHFGFRLARTAGRHEVWLREADGVSIPVPRNRGSGGIPVGTVVSTLRQAGIGRNDALAFWRIN